MIGKCDSCGKIRGLTTQTNFGVRRRMCRGCCESANECERLMKLSPSQKADVRNRSSYGKAAKQEFVEKLESVPANWLELMYPGEE